MIEDQNRDGRVEDGAELLMTRRDLGWAAVKAAAGLPLISLLGAASELGASEAPAVEYKSIRYVRGAQAKEAVAKAMDVPDCASMVEHFEKLGFEFLPERAQVAVIQPMESRQGPVTLVVLPSLTKGVKSFEGTSSHECVGISVGLGQKTVAAIAAVAEVSHRPFRIQSFRSARSVGGQIRLSESISSEELSSLSHSRAMAKLGHEPRDARKLDRSLPIDAQIGSLAIKVAETSTKDAHSSPKYPKGAIDSLLRNPAPIGKFAHILARTSLNHASATIGIVLCTSTSCEGCSSSSSTIEMAY